MTNVIYSLLTDKFRDFYAMLLNFLHEINNQKGL